MRACSAAVLVGTLLFVRVSAADDAARERARAAYDEALEQVDAGNFARAATLFARADALEENDLALKSALQATLQADLPALGMELAERAENRSHEELRIKAETARASFADRVGELRVGCGGARHCSVRVDGLPFAAGEWHFVTVGDHQVVIEQNGDVIPSTIHVNVGGRLEVDAPEVIVPAPKTKTIRVVEPSADIAIHPAFFWTGVALTAALTGGTIASAIDTNNLHEDFEATGLGAEDGEGAKLRTNVLLGVTLGVAATSVVLAVLTDWSDDAPRVGVFVDDRGGRAALELDW